MSSCIIYVCKLLLRKNRDRISYKIKPTSSFLLSTLLFSNVCFTRCFSQWWYLMNDWFLDFWVEEIQRRSLSVDPFNHQKSSRYSSLVAVGLWLSFIGLNWTSFSWYAARINSLALSSCLALKHLCKYRVCLKYLDLSLSASRVDFRSPI